MQRRGLCLANGRDQAVMEVTANPDVARMVGIRPASYWVKESVAFTRIDAGLSSCSEPARCVQHHVPNSMPCLTDFSASLLLPCTAFSVIPANDMNNENDEKLFGTMWCIGTS